MLDRYKMSKGIPWAQGCYACTGYWERDFHGYIPDVVVPKNSILPRDGRTTEAKPDGGFDFSVHYSPQDRVFPRATNKGVTPEMESL